MKLTTSIFVLLALTMSACTNWQTAKFEVTNATGFVIDSLYFQPSTAQSRTYISIEPKKTKTYYLNMEEAKGDGAYGIFFKSKGRQRGMAFGYYSNGNVGEKVTKIQIEPDTLLLKPVYNSY